MYTLVVKIYAELFYTVQNWTIWDKGHMHKYTSWVLKLSKGQQDVE